MRRFTDAVRTSLATHNWYGALVSALILPDICGSLETPGTNNSKERATRWFKKWMEPKYTTEVDDPILVKSWLTAVDREAKRKAIEDLKRAPRVRKTSLSAADYYALRCALTHEGVDNIEHQRAKEALDRFVFVAPTPGRIIHNNLAGSKLQLDVAIFCDEIAVQVDNWDRAVANDAPLQERKRQLIRIAMPGESLAF
jgi:hypothetical protein